MCLSVCLCVCVQQKWDVRGAGLDYSDERPSYFNLFTEPQTLRRMFENIGLESSWGCKRMHAIGKQQSKQTQSGEQQLKRTQSGSSSRSGHDREQQLKWTQTASMQQQLKRAQSGSSSSAQRAVRHRITHGRRMRGK